MTTIKLDHLFKAQFGEDRILWQVFRGRPNGYFVEIGAFDGVTISNTFFLEQMGWGGLLIEPIEELCQRAVAARPRSRVINAAVSKKGSQGTATFTVAQNIPVLSFLSADEEHVERCVREGAQLVEIEVPLTTVDDVLKHERQHAPTGMSPWDMAAGWQIDFVSVDTEGCELDVLDGFDLERFKPRVLLMENDRPSGAGIEAYLESRGYRKFHRVKINEFYVRSDDASEDIQLGDFAMPS